MRDEKMVAVGYRELPWVTGNDKVDWNARGRNEQVWPCEGRRETLSTTRRGQNGKIIDGKIMKTIANLRFEISKAENLRRWRYKAAKERKEHKGKIMRGKIIRG